MRAWLPLLGGLILLAGCGAQQRPDAALPAVPDPLPGWTSMGSFGGQSGSGMVGAEFDLDLSSDDVAISAACTGDGLLAVFIGLETLNASAGQVPTAVFRCTASADVGRVELAEPPPEGSAFSAALIEAPGGRREAFNVSIEVRGD